MGSDDTIDFELMLKPIGGENPAGVNLKEHDDGALYYLTKGPRDDSVRIEQKHFEQPEAEEYQLSRRQWDEARRQAVAVLSEKSKDFDVATWLCEALIREEGFAGLRDGFRLIRQFAEDDEIWNNCYPPAESTEAGLSFGSRMKMLRSLLEGGTLGAAVSNIPLTEIEKFTLIEYQQADRMKDIVDEDERKASLGGLRDVKLSQFESDAANSSDTFCRNLADDVAAARDELKRMTDTLYEKCGTDEIGQPVAPSPRKLDESFQQVLNCVTEVYGPRIKPAVEAPSVTEGGELITGDNSLAAMNSGGGVSPNAASGGMTREMAFELLSQLARFFEDKEPANPASFQIRKAMRCGAMTLPEILKEAIPDDDERRTAFLNLGMDFEQPEE